jgi:hypothetical protein
MNKNEIVAQRLREIADAIEDIANAEVPCRISANIYVHGMRESDRECIELAFGGGFVLGSHEGSHWREQKRNQTNVDICLFREVRYV